MNENTPGAGYVYKPYRKPVRFRTVILKNDELVEVAKRIGALRSKTGSAT